MEDNLKKCPNAKGKSKTCIGCGEEVSETICLCLDCVKLGRTHARLGYSKNNHN